MICLLTNFQVIFLMKSLYFIKKNILKNQSSMDIILYSLKLIFWSFLMECNFLLSQRVERYTAFLRRFISMVNYLENNTILIFHAINVYLTLIIFFSLEKLYQVNKFVCLFWYLMWTCFGRFCPRNSLFTIHETLKMIKFSGSK